MLRYLIGGAVVVFIVLLAVGGVTGRVRASNCCSTVDPEVDARLRDPEANPRGAQA